MVAGALLTVSLLGGCQTSDPVKAHLTELEKVYNQGKEARSSMTKRGIEVTDATCAEMFTSTDADKGLDSSDKGFQAQRRSSYINGCMNRPNASPSPSAKTTD